MKASWTEKSAAVVTVLLVVATIAGAMLIVNCLNISKANTADIETIIATNTLNSENNGNNELAIDENSELSSEQVPSTGNIIENTVPETVTQMASAESFLVSIDETNYTIKFISNNAAVTFESQTVKSGSKITLPQVTAKQLGIMGLGNYKIDSWVMSTGSMAESFAPGEEVAVTSNTTFTAHWSSKAQQCINNGKHTATIEPIKNATCSAVGSGNQVCSICGATIKENVTIAKAPHSYDIVGNSSYKDNTGLEYNGKNVFVLRCKNDLTHVAKVALSASDASIVAANESDLYMSVNDTKTFAFDSSYAVSILSNTGSSCEATLNKDNHTITFTAKKNGNSNFLIVGDKAGKKYLTVVEVFVGDTAFSEYEKSLELQVNSDSIYVYSLGATMMALDSPINVGTLDNTSEQDANVDDKNASAQEEVEENEDKSTVNQPLVVASERIDTTESAQTKEASQMKSLPQAGDDTSVLGLVFWSIVFMSSVTGLWKLKKH